MNAFAATNAAYQDRSYEFRDCSTGIGAFATRNIAVGSRIAVMTGEIVSTADTFTRMGSGTLRADDPLQIEEDLYICLAEDCLYFNHSCDPNAGIRNFNILFALKDIDEGEEIRFDYSTAVGVAPINTMWSMKCRCGSPVCRREIGCILTIPKQIIEQYARAGALPRFIVRQLCRGNFLASP